MTKRSFSSSTIKYGMLIYTFFWVAACAGNSPVIDHQHGDSSTRLGPKNIQLEVGQNIKLLQAKNVEGRFQSPYGDPSPNKNFFDYLKMRLTNEEPYSDWFDEADRPPVTQLDVKRLHQPPSHPQASWIGHSTALIQHNGINVLTDPIFSDYASPVQFAGPKRIAPPAIEVKDLPNIDVIIMSHNHYDHLDEDSVMALASDQFSTTLWMVPLGMGEFLIDAGINANNVHEFNWWQSINVQGVTVTSTPSIHWTGRGLWDRNEQLWAAWHVDFGDFTFWFGGDTGYHDTLFKDIASAFGPVDLGVIPIGAYKPRNFMKYHHVNPDEAVQIHKDIQARYSFGIHWGTFQLTGETLLDPPKQLDKLKQEGEIHQEEFDALAIGQTIRLMPDEQVAKE